MTIEQNLVAFRKSITDELLALKNRVRDLIGSSHWQTDGEHKETILRRILKIHAPGTVRIGKGFVCYPSLLSDPTQTGQPICSGQIDILVTSLNRPVLYREDDLQFVTADSVEAIIEVKTKVKSGKSKDSLWKVLEKLSTQVEHIRRNSIFPNKCHASLFVFDKTDLEPTYVLRAVKNASKKSTLRVIDTISIGLDNFVKYWDAGSKVKSPIKGPVWHLYHLKNLSQTYLLGNIIVHLSPGIPDKALRAWFPLYRTKEEYRVQYVPFYRGRPTAFPQQTKDT